MGQLDRFNALVKDLETGKVRVAEKVDGEWKVNSWVKEIILEVFKYGKLTEMSEGHCSGRQRCEDRRVSRSFSDSHASVICQYRCICGCGHHD